MATDDPLAPYLHLVELAETECSLIQAGHTDELAGVQTAWLAAIAHLPVTPPAAARQPLERALALSRQSAIAMQHGLSVISNELGTVDRTRIAGRAYAQPSGPMSGRSIDAAA